ncbi:MAG: ChuX/HutX family heme-like substrate-binding protein [Verrucomicrobiota bacterium]
MRPKKIREEAERLKESQPKITPIKLAAALKVTEAELTAAYTGEGPVIRLNTDREMQLHDLHALGQVLLVVRNTTCIHELVGNYPQARFYGGHALLAADSFMMHYDLTQWSYGFAVEKNGMRNLEFFDQRGRAVHKVFTTDQTNFQSWNDWVSRYAAEKQSPIVEVERLEEIVPDDIDQREVSRDALCATWDTLTTSDDFQPMIDHLGLSSLEAIRLGGDAYAKRLSKDALGQFLNHSVQESLSIEATVCSSGTTQNYKGQIKQVTEFGDWLNVLDPHFNLHIDMKAVDSIWMVQKAKAKKPVTVIEVLNRDGKSVLELSESQPVQQPDSSVWKAVIESLPAPVQEEEYA